MTQSPRPQPSPESWSALSADRLEAEMQTLGQPAYRSRQLHAALHHNCVWNWESISPLPSQLRSQLADLRPLRSLAVERDRSSARDPSRKVLFRTADGQNVESVLMRSTGGLASRHTICVSSQVGCPAACSFCASGIGGLVRNLTTAEILDQAELFAGELRGTGQRIDNVVYMGMGEPFLNYNRVMESMRLLNATTGLGVGTRRMTVSTVGIVPAIRRFGTEAGEPNLAISLHAPTDELRSTLVPYNRRFPIADILAAVREYIDATHRRVSFEYVLLKNVNDADHLADELAELLAPLKGNAHVNLIPWNPFPGTGFNRATREAADNFAARVRTRRMNVTIRYSKGLDIDAACGQLRARTTEEALAS